MLAIECKSKLIFFILIILAIILIAVIIVIIFFIPIKSIQIGFEIKMTGKRDCLRHRLILNQQATIYRSIWAQNLHYCLR